MLLYTHTHTERLTKPLGNFMFAKFKRATRGFRFSLFTHRPVEKCGACHYATKAKSIFHHFQVNVVHERIRAKNQISSIYLRGKKVWEIVLRAAANRERWATGNIRGNEHSRAAACSK